MLGRKRLRQSILFPTVEWMVIDGGYFGGWILAKLGGYHTLYNANPMADS